MTSIRGTVILSVSAITVVAGAVLVLAIGSEPEALTTIPGQEPVLVAVQRVISDEAVQTTATLSTADPFNVTPSADGIVTDVEIQPGARLNSGDVVGAIDGDAVVAFMADAPLYRTLGRGSQGEDVEQLQQFLTEVTDLPVGSDGAFGVQTARAVSAMRDDFGLPDGATIGPAELVWIGPEPLLVTAVDVRVGDRVSVGDVLAEGPPREVTLAVASDLHSFDDGRLSLTVGGQVVQIARDGTVADDDARAVFAALGEFEQEPAVVTLAEPISLSEVPASALLTGEDGSTCVVTADGSTVPVTVSATSFGRTRLAADVDRLPDQVIGNPQVVRDRC